MDVFVWGLNGRRKTSIYKTTCTVNQWGIENTPQVGSVERDEILAVIHELNRICIIIQATAGDDPSLFCHDAKLAAFGCACERRIGIEQSALDVRRRMKQADVT